MRSLTILLAASVVQFLGLVVAAMFIDAAWPRNVYPYVRYPRWIDWAMFTGMALLVAMLLASAIAGVSLMVRQQSEGT